MSLEYNGATASTSHQYEEFVKSFYDYLIDSVLLVPVFKMHRLAKIANIIGPLAPTLKRESSAHIEEYDIFGHANISQKPQKNMEVFCDECKRTIANLRFLGS